MLRGAGLLVNHGEGIGGVLDESNAEARAISCGALGDGTPPNS